MYGSRAYIHGLSALALALGCGSPAPNDFAASVAAGTPSGGSGGQAAGGAAGKAGSGGSSGSGGAIGDVGSFEDNEDPIDDMEDGNSQVMVWSGRDGHWYVISDMTGGTTTPAAGVNFTMATNNVPRGVSRRSAGLSGSNFTDWGAALVFDLRNPVGGTVLPYDASAYTGLSFYGRSLRGELAVRITVPDASSHPAGGICAAETCYNHYHSDVTLAAAWRKLEVPFSALSKDGVTGGSFNESVIFSVEFVVPGKTAFEFQIDDIAFTEQ